MKNLFQLRKQLEINDSITKNRKKSLIIEHEKTHQQKLGEFAQPITFSENYNKAHIVLDIPELGIEKLDKVSLQNTIKKYETIRDAATGVNNPSVTDLQTAKILESRIEVLKKYR